MLKRISIFFVFYCLSFALFAQQNTDWLYEGLEFQMEKVKEPVFPNRSVNIEDFGAKCDGLFKNTEVIASAIQSVADQGGGKVIIPRGIWLTGPITLKSNINLHLEEGALLLFSEDFDDYPIVKTSFEGLNTVRCISPINALNESNIAITGKGVIDGNGQAWRPVKKGKMTAGQWEKLLKSGGVLSEDERIWFPSESSKKGYESTTNFNVPDLVSDDELQSVKDFLRPVMVSIRKCKNVLLEGVTFQNSPAWNIHPLMSENLIIRNLNVRNPWYSQNGDGLDLESCKNVVIYNNTFDVGDDAICFKSGKNQDGRDRGMPTENVIVKNNTVYHGHGGFVVGSEMSGGVKNVHVSNCTFIGTDVGLRFKSTRGRGGIVENIYISNIDMINIPTEAIRFNLFYGGNSPVLEEDQSEEDEARDETVMPVTEETPSFRNIFMNHITVSNSNTAAFFMGLPEMKLQNVELKNSSLEAENGITIIDANGIKFENVSIHRKSGPGLTLYNTTDGHFSRVKFNETGEKPIRMLGNTSAINIDGSEVPIYDLIQESKKKDKSTGSATVISTAEELNAALDNPNPGDVFQLSPGTYHLSERIFINDSGTKSQPITLQGQSFSNRPILDFSALEENSSNQGIVLKADHWIVKNIEIRKAGDNGLHLRGSNNQIENCAFYENSDTGLQLDSGASNNTIKNCDSYYNADSSLENADGFAVKMDVGSGNRFIGCRSWNNLDDGWDGYLRGTNDVTTYFENCWAIRNGYLKNGNKGKGDGNGFKTGGSDDKLKKHNAFFKNSIAFENINDGFDHNSNRGIVSIENSIAMGNGINYDFSEKNSLKKLSIKHSISIGNLGKFNAEQLDIHENSWQSSSQEVSSNLAISNEALTAPRKENGDLPDILPNINTSQNVKNGVTIYLVGDSTMADYSGNYDPGKDYMKTRYPVMGWGQVFQDFFQPDSLQNLQGLIGNAKVVKVEDRARGGRSTRTFFQEGRWRAVYEQLQPNDIVIMQFGHNDAAENKPERYVDIEGYKEFLRLFVSQSREKQAIPIILTPVARNYPWENGVLNDVHGDYDQAPKDVANELNAALIDLNLLSRQHFTKMGKEYTTENYFMNIPAGKYEAYPDGQNDNTHFQPEGAKAVAALVFQGLKKIEKTPIK